MIILHLLTALAATASFDNQPEGTVARSIQENGVTISNFWNGIDPPPGVLTVEQADGTLAGMAGFSPLNTLGFGGYVPGDGAAFGSFVSIELRGPAGSNAARVEVFDFFNQNISMRMEAWRGGQIVATDSVALSSYGGVAHSTLQVRAAGIDYVSLVCGPGQGTPCFVELDNVTFAEVGAPGDTAVPVDTDLPVDTDPPDTDLPQIDDTPHDTVPADTDPPAVDTDLPADTDAADTDSRIAEGETDDPQPVDTTQDKAAPAGCGCHTSASSAAPVALLGLLLARRRRVR